MIKVYDFIALFALSAFRGIYLLALIPAAFFGWLFVHAWWQKSSYGACLGWYDWNIYVFLASGLVGSRVDRYIREFPYVRLVDMSKVSHRVGRMGRTLRNLEGDSSKSKI
jgi:hypothetical protein